jgi:maltooligosyltrehalose synthase
MKKMERLIPTTLNMQNKCKQVATHNTRGENMRARQEVLKELLSLMKAKMKEIVCPVE